MFLHQIPLQIVVLFLCFCQAKKNAKLHDAYFFQQKHDWTQQKANFEQQISRWKQQAIQGVVEKIILIKTDGSKSAVQELAQLAEDHSDAFVPNIIGNFGEDPLKQVYDQQERNNYCWAHASASMFHAHFLRWFPDLRLRSLFPWLACSTQTDCDRKMHDMLFNLAYRIKKGGNLQIFCERVGPVLGSLLVLFGQTSSHKIVGKAWMAGALLQQVTPTFGFSDWNWRPDHLLYPQYYGEKYPMYIGPPGKPTYSANTDHAMVLLDNAGTVLSSYGNDHGNVRWPNNRFYNRRIQSESGASNGLLWVDGTSRLQSQDEKNNMFDFKIEAYSVASLLPPTVPLMHPVNMETIATSLSVHDLLERHCSADSTYDFAFAENSPSVKLSRGSVNKQRSEKSLHIHLDFVSDSKLQEITFPKVLSMQSIKFLDNKTYHLQGVIVQKPHPESDLNDQFDISETHYPKSFRKKKIEADFTERVHITLAYEEEEGYKSIAADVEQLAIHNRRLFRSKSPAESRP